MQATSTVDREDNKAILINNAIKFARISISHFIFGHRLMSFHKQALSRPIAPICITSSCSTCKLAVGVLLRALVERVGDVGEFVFGVVGHVGFA